MVQTQLSAGTIRSFPPPVTVSLSRRLYRRSPKEATLTASTGPNPSLVLSLVSPSMFDFSLDAYSPSSDDGARVDEPKPVSYSGFGAGTFYKSYSLVLAGISTGLKAEWGLIFTELAVQVKLALEYGLLSGLGGAATASWTHGKSEIATSVGLNQLGVMLRVRLQFLIWTPLSIVFSHDVKRGNST
jgi:DnaJ family protein C protein 11